MAKTPLPMSKSVGLTHSMTMASRNQQSPLYTQATWDTLLSFKPSTVTAVMQLTLSFKTEKLVSVNLVYTYLYGCNLQTMLQETYSSLTSHSGKSGKTGPHSFINQNSFIYSVQHFERISFNYCCFDLESLTFRDCCHGY